MKKEEKGQNNEINEKEKINIEENKADNDVKNESTEPKVIKNKEDNVVVETNKENKKTENSETNQIKDSTNKEDKKQEEPKKEKGKHKVEKKASIKAIIFIALTVVILLFISTIFAILNIYNSNIIKGVFIENIDVSNLTKEGLKNIVAEKVEAVEEVELKHGEYSTIVKLEELGLEIDFNSAISKAINLGKTNNIIIDNYSILKANIFKTKLELDIKIDDLKFEETIKNIQAEIPEAIKEYSYEIKAKELIITNGEAGEKIIAEELKNKIIDNIREQFNGEVKVADIPTKVSDPKNIDIQKVYNEVHKEAKNAYIVENENGEIVKINKEEDGIDFAITIEEANEVIKEEKETYSIPLKITEPKIKIKDLGDKLFKQTLAKYTTIYDAGNKNRSHNIALAAKTINGTILLPGETFSYNGVLGNTNKEKGYKVGTAYVGGKVVESYGGGICQVSSTLYNSVLYANLEIVQRYNHSYIVSYVPAGRDATVAYGGKDFKFKNTRNYPIKIVASAKNGVVSVSIMGLKEETEYEIVLTSTVLSTTPRSVVYEENSELEEGKQKVIQNGYDGKKSIAYKTVKHNGKTISKTVLSKDTYKPMNQIIQVGTKKVVTEVITTPTVTEPVDTTTTIQ